MLFTVKSDQCPPHACMYSTVHVPNPPRPCNPHPAHLPHTRRPQHPSRTHPIHTIQPYPSCIHPLVHPFRPLHPLRGRMPVTVAPSTRGVRAHTCVRSFSTVAAPGGAQVEDASHHAGGWPSTPFMLAATPQLRSCRPSVLRSWYAHGSVRVGGGPRHAPSSPTRVPPPPGKGSGKGQG